MRMDRRVLWLTFLKAVEKSMRKQTDDGLADLAAGSFSVMATRVVSVVFSTLKPNWFGS